MAKLDKLSIPKLDIELPITGSQQISQDGNTQPYKKGPVTNFIINSALRLHNDMPVHKNSGNQDKANRGIGVRKFIEDKRLKGVKISDETTNQAVEAFNRLIDYGFTSDYAAGIIANLYNESKFNPDASNTVKKEDGTVLYHEGVAQLQNDSSIQEGNRLDDYKNWLGNRKDNVLNAVDYFLSRVDSTRAWNDRKNKLDSLHQRYIGSSKNPKVKEWAGGMPNVVRLLKDKDEYNRIQSSPDYQKIGMSDSLRKFRESVNREGIWLNPDRSEVDKNTFLDPSVYLLENIGKLPTGGEAAAHFSNTYERHDTDIKNNKARVRDALEIINGEDINSKTEYAEGGEITEEDKAKIRAYMPLLEEQAYLNNARQAIRQSYGKTSEIERDLDGNIININYIPIRDVTSDVVMGAATAGALGRVGIKLGKAGLQMYNKAASELVNSAPKGLDIVTPGKIGKNIDDIRYARYWNKDYGYPELSYTKALSTKATDDAIKNTITRHNTFYRGTTPPRKPIAELEIRGIQGNSKEAAKYMSEHIPPNSTGAARVGMSDSELQSNIGGLYTSNTKTIAGAHAGNSGYITTVRKPMDLSSTNRRDWVSKNIDRSNIDQVRIDNSTNFIFKGPVGSKPVEAVKVTPIKEVEFTDLGRKRAALPKLDKPNSLSFIDNPAVKVAEVLTETPKRVVTRTGIAAGGTIGSGLVKRYLDSTKE